MNIIQKRIINAYTHSYIDIIMNDEDDHDEHRDYCIMWLIAMGMHDTLKLKGKLKD